MKTGHKNQKPNKNPVLFSFQYKKIEMIKILCKKYIISLNTDTLKSCLSL